MLSGHHARAAGHKFRLLTTALAVTLGVAFMAGTLVLTDTMGKTFDNLFADVYKGTDAVVRAKAAFDGPQCTGEQRGRSSTPRWLDTLRRVPGVAAAEGSVFGYARLIGKDGKALGNPANGAPTLGGNWTEIAALNPLHLLSGRAPQAAGEVVIDQKSATRRPPRASVTRPPSWCRDRRSGSQVVGIVGFGTADSPGGASVVLFTTPVAQRLSRAARQVRPASCSSPGRACHSSSWSATSRAVLPARPRGDHRRDAHQGEPGPVRQGAVVLQHLPADLRRGRAAGRRLHDLQHLLHHGRAAHQGERPAARARREPAAGARRGAGRGRGGRHRSRR